MSKKNYMDVVMTYSPQTCYEKDGIVFLPMYEVPGRFVGPGYGRQTFITYTAIGLEKMGARPQTRMLWDRVRGAAL